MTCSPEDGDLVADDPKVKVPADVAEAVRTLIRWAGDDPDREGLLDTPARVARAWREYARGYVENPARHLARTFHEVGGYDEIVLLKDIPFQSHCEHHMAPIIGKAAIAYLPSDKVVGISKLARVLHGFARRRHARRDDDHQPDDGDFPQRRAQPTRGAGADGVLGGPRPTKAGGQGLQNDRLMPTSVRIRS